MLYIIKHHNVHTPYSLDYIVYRACIDVGLQPLLITEVRKMRVYERERPLKSFIIPNESFKWDFILEKYITEDEAEREAREERRHLERTDGFDKDYIVAHRKRRTQDRYFY